jgi:hypothetical protein
VEGLESRVEEGRGKNRTGRSRPAAQDQIERNEVECKRCGNAGGFYRGRSGWWKAGE